MAQSSYNPLNFPSDESLEGVSCYDNEMNFGKSQGHLRIAKEPPGD